MDDGAAEDEVALGVAIRWLGLLDRGRLRAALRSASGELKNGQRSERGFLAGTTEHKWCTEVGRVRLGLGVTRSRRIVSVSRVEAGGTGEGGTGVSVQFATMFDRCEAARESVVICEHPDGVRRVSAYRILLGAPWASARAGAA